MAEQAPGGTGRVVMDPEAKRRAREDLRSQLVSLEARLDEAGRAARECITGWGIASMIEDACADMGDAIEMIDKVLENNP